MTRIDMDTHRTEQRVEDALFLMEAGESKERVADRLNLTMSGLEKLLERKTRGSRNADTGAPSAASEEPRDEPVLQMRVSGSGG